MPPIPFRLAPACLAALLAASSAFAGSDGALDPSFGDGGIAFLKLDGVEGHELRAGAAIALPDGKLLFGGSRNLRMAGNPDPAMRPMLARMNADGSPDTGFGADPNNPGILVLPSISATGMQMVEGMARFDDGAIVVAGSAFAFGPLSGWIEKLDADGQPDASFGDGGRVLLANTYLHAVAIDSRQRVVVAGERMVHLEGDPPTAFRASRGFVARLDGSGQLDTSFGPSADGTALLDADVETDNVYAPAMMLDAADGVFVGGSYEDNEAFVSQHSLAHFDADGLLDPAFAGSGWRRFVIPGDGPTFNGIDVLVRAANGGVTFAGHHDAGEGTTSIVVGQVDASGADDAAFGDAATPGSLALDVPAAAYYRNARSLLRQGDGKLLVAVSYSGEDKQDFVAARLTPGGDLDTGFGSGGTVDLDLAPGPNGAYSDLGALALQDGKPILAGLVKRDASSFFADLGVARLQGGDGSDDAIFADGFDGAPAVPVVSDYDDLVEGRLGTSFHYNGVNYRDCNGIAGVFPDGSTFDADYPGEQFIIEDATSFYPDFPQYGSAPNALTFGFMYAEGTSVSLGGFVRATLDLDAPASALRFDAAYYENGPWGGIEFHVDAYRDGKVVASDMLTISDHGGRDNATVTTMGVSGAVFDSVKIYATYDGQPSAPRLMIDNLEVTPAR